MGTRRPDLHATWETALAKTASIFFFFFFSLFISSSLNIFASEPPSPAVYGVRMEQSWIPM
jgi:hypothetical protein